MPTRQFAGARCCVHRGFEAALERPGLGEGCGLGVNAGAEAGKYYKDRSLMRARARAAFDFLAARPQVDAARMAVMFLSFIAC